MSLSEHVKSIERGAEYLDEVQQLAKDEQAIRELAALPRMQFDRAVKEKAKELSVKTSTLEKAVKDARNGSKEEGLKLDNPDPFPGTVNGAELLDEIVSLLNRYIVLPKYAPETIALWALFTYVFESMRICPMLTVTSPEKRCGKTSTLTLLFRLTSRALPASNIGPAAVFRTIEKYKPTLLIDEADTFLKNNEELRGILNSGHTREMAYSIRLVGDNYDSKQFSTWGPKAIATIGKLKDTLIDRSIVISMRRKKPGEKVERLREFDSKELKSRCVRWANDNTEKLKNCDPDIPDSLHDRAADNWEPLLVIADLAGGKWPEIARKAAIELSLSEIDEDSIKVQLLIDIKSVFESSRIEKIWTDSLLEELHGMSERAWGEWNKGRALNARNLAKLLRGFKVSSKDVRIDREVKKGYQLADFKEAFACYIPHLSATALQSSNDGAFSDIQNATQITDVADRNSLKPAPDKECSVVADKNTGRGANGEDKELMQALIIATEGLPITPERLLDVAAPEDYSALIEDAQMARDFAKSVSRWVT